MGNKTYRIVRFFQDDDTEKRTMRTGLTLTDAQAHCHDPETSSSTATSAVARALTAEMGAWFDGYEEEQPGDYGEPEQTGPGTRRKSAGFPECLMVETAGAAEQARRSRTLDWTRRHNRAVQAFMADQHEPTGELKPSERAVLGLAAGIETWLSSTGEGASDGFGAEHITKPLFRAFNNALNYDLGRLDGGTLSSWATDRVRSLGFNPDTFDRIS